MAYITVSCMVVFGATSQLSTGCCSVATLVLILCKSPYKDQNGKNGPYLVLIFDFSPYFEEIEERTANLIKLLVC